MRAADAMRRDWDDRAQKNALFYIEDSRADWDEEAFFLSGERNYCDLVAPALEELRLDPAGKTVIELGCGAGRMTRSFANRFKDVVGIDISMAMLNRGQELLAGMPNIKWVHGNGLDLGNVESGSADFAFSYLVMQHMPTTKVVCDYVSEIVRVLRPGGAFLFQFNSRTAPTMNLRGRAAWAVVDAFWSLGLVALSRRIAGALGFDPLLAGRTWRGAVVSGAEMRRFTESVGGTVVGIMNDGKSDAWCYGTKAVPAGVSSL